MRLYCLAMDLNDLIDRQPIAPWSGASKIPWSEPEFSKRMLREHLNQQQTAASRPFSIIDEQVAWIHTLLGKRSQRVLDLGCGPGFYTERLTRLGHACVGIDFSPASIDYARKHDATSTYRLADLRDGGFGPGFDAAMLIYGEFNAFAPEEARSLLSHVNEALDSGGRFVLETHEAAYVRRQGQRPPHWFTSNAGVFSDRPHVCLHECHWHEAAQATTDRYYIMETETAEAVETDTPTVTEYVNTLQAYSEPEVDHMLENAGFTGIQRFPSLSGHEKPDTEGLSVITAAQRT